MKYERWKEPFDRAGMWIVSHVPGLLCGKQGRQIEKRLKLLETSREQISLEAYYGRKFSRLLKLLFAGGLLLGCLALRFSGEVKWMEQPVIQRPPYGAGSLETELTARIHDQGELDIPVTIEEQKYSQEEIQQIFNDIFETVETNILGENPSLMEIKTDLCLPSSFRNGVITAQWDIDPPDYMDDTGQFLCEIPGEGLVGTLRLTLTYGREEMIRELPVQFLPRDESPEEQAVRSLRAAVEAADKEAPHGTEVELPQKLEGMPVRWGSRVASPLMAGVILLAAGLWYLYGKDDRALAEEEKHRREQMIIDYPVILYKMSMLLEAGMTIRGAFSRIAFHYREQRSKEVRYAYEEMLLTCFEMEKGIGEGTAYEMFGQKCRDLRYLKFGSLLSQNLKKGSKGLVEILEQEAEAGMEERKNLARKLGEEASTKLLLPMMLMLMQVVAILMVPAMLSF